VQIGSVVVVATDAQEPETYRLVGAKEANPRQGLISHLSPIGKALLGKAVGEEAVVDTPGGQVTLKILEIQ
jgi:transcription elongation factor GreA